jgi:hypothetical protein
MYMDEIVWHTYLKTKKKKKKKHGLLKYKKNT